MVFKISFTNNRELIMKIVFITDIHGDWDKLESISPRLINYDLVVLGGDITTFGTARDADFVVKTILKYNQNIIAIPGNCDGAFVQKLLVEKGMDFNFKKIERFGTLFYGIGGSLITPSATPYEYSEEYLNEQLNDKSYAELSVLSNLILVSHQPPLFTLNDKLSTGVHVGSKSIRNLITKTKPFICLTGHIHEGIGIDKIENTPIVNPGALCDGKYGEIYLYDNEISEIKFRTL